MSIPNELLVFLNRDMRLIPAKGKAPFLDNWPEKATTNKQTIDLWCNAFPNTNWAVATGRGIMVLDVDGERGQESIDKWRNNGKLPPTFQVITSNGCHLYYRFPPHITVTNSVKELASGIDIRGDGGCVVVPPSVHESGTVYSFHDSNAAIAAAPEWLVDAIRNLKNNSHVVGTQPVPCEVGMRERIYADKALEKECDRLLQMGEGDGRNTALNTAAFNMGTLITKGWISREHVQNALLDASEKNGYVKKDGPQQAWATIQSGLDAGIKKPHAPLPAAQVSTTNQVPLPTNSSIEMYEVTAQDIEPIEWLWEGFLPLGKLTLLAGAPGTGKSTLAFSMAATVSIGAAWPDGTPCKCGHVVVFSTEDDVADTIAPRLQAMNADFKRVHFIKGKRNAQGLLLPFDPATDMHTLKSSIQQLGEVSLLIIDPITSAVTGDMNKSNEVRRGLQALVDFASEMNCAVVGISHFSKGTNGRNPSERVIGSVAFSAFARVVLVAAKEEDSEQRVFTRAKSNISLDSGGFLYTIEPIRLPKNIIATRIEWGGILKGSAREILATAEGDDTAHLSSSQINEAKAFLLGELTNGPRLAKELIAVAKDQLSINEKTLQRARQKVGVETFKQGFRGPWYWKLSIKDNNGTSPNCSY